MGVCYLGGMKEKNVSLTVFFKCKAENINAIELCQTTSVVIYSYFVSSLCCDQETSWFRNILAHIIGYED